MRKRPSPSEPLFRFLEIDAADVARHASVIDDILRAKLDGVIVRGAIPPDAARRVHASLTQGEVPFARRTFNGFPEAPTSPFTYGRALVSATPDLKEYFELAGDTRARLRQLFAMHGIDLEARLGEVFGALAGGMPVAVPDGPGGATYAPATFRFLPEGRDIGVHVGNSFLRLPQAQHLAQLVDVGAQLSYFVTVAAPDAGGELVVYGLEWDDVARLFPAEINADQVVYDQSGLLVPLLELCDKQAYKPGDGDLLLFDGGRYYHRVTATMGTRARCTLGGFLALSRDKRTLCYWS